MSVGSSSNTQKDLEMINDTRAQTAQSEQPAMKQASTAKTPEAAYDEMIKAASEGKKVSVDTVKMALQDYPEEYERFVNVCSNEAIVKAANENPNYMVMLLSADYSNPETVKKLNLVAMDPDPNNIARQKFLHDAEKGAEGQEFVNQSIALAENFSAANLAHWLMGLNAGSAGLLGKSKFNGILRCLSAWFGPEKLLSVFGSAQEGYSDEQMKLVNEIGEDNLMAARDAAKSDLSEIARQRTSSLGLSKEVESPEPGVGATLAASQETKTTPAFVVGNER